MAWMEAERQALVMTFRGADPEAPTLCAGWNTRRLLAHLVQREHAPWQRAADALRRPQPGQEKNLTLLTQAAETPEGYEALIRKFAGGSSRWSPLSWLGDSGQLVEYVVHHEDVRRAGDVPAAPRGLPAGEEQALWQQLNLLAKLSYRKSPVGVDIALPGGDRRTVRKGPDAVALTGSPVELALHALGRRTVAQVHVTGSQAGVEDFREWAENA